MDLLDFLRHSAFHRKQQTTNKFLNYMHNVSDHHEFMHTQKAVSIVALDQWHWSQARLTALTHEIHINLLKETPNSMSL